jgi:hypothetical protein
MPEKITAFRGVEGIEVQSALRLLWQGLNRTGYLLEKQKKFKDISALN